MRAKIATVVGVVLLSAIALTAWLALPDRVTGDTPNQAPGQPAALASPTGTTSPAGGASVGPTVASPTSVPSGHPIPSADVTAEPEPSGVPEATPFPTPGPTITPGSTRVIGTIVRADGSPAQGVCVVLEKGVCPIATDAQGVWFTDIPAGPIAWNFIYKVNGQVAGRQSVSSTPGGELRLPRFTLTG